MKQSTKRQKQQTVTMPRYLTRFACLGSACEDNCCHGWNVGVDPETFGRYQQVTDPDLGPLLRSSVVANQPEDGQYQDARAAAHIALKPDGACPLLTSDGWCGVQQKLGYRLLPMVCAGYPRVEHAIDGVRERAAVLSCPESARLALLAPDAMDLVEVDETVAPRIMVNRVAMASRRPDDPLRHFHVLRSCAIELLRRSEVSLEARLVVLGLALRRIGQHTTLTRADAQEIFHHYTSQLAPIQQELAGVEPQHSIQVGLLRDLVAQRLSMGVGHKGYQSCVERMLSALGLRDGRPDPEVLQTYADALQAYYVPYVAEHPHVWENYLLNQILSSSFPFRPDRSLFDEYVMLIVGYALTKLHLVGVAAFERRLNDQLVVEVIYSLQRSVDHNAKYLGRALDLLRRNDIIDMAYMGILIVS